MGLSLSVQATLLVFDPFTDGGASDGADPLDIPWVPVGSGALTVTDDTAGIGSGNALDREAGTTSFRGVRGDFTPVSLSTPGQQLELILDFRIADGPFANGSGFRFGLGNSANTYVYAMGTGGTLGSNIFFNPSAATGGGGQVTFTGQSGIGISITDTLSHVGRFLLTRTTTGINFEATVDGVNPRTAVFNASDPNFFDSFSAIQIGNGGVNQRFLVDNVQLRLIPEPNVVGLMALGAVVVRLVRRR